MQKSGGLKYATGVNLYILYFLESIFACAVNLFVLITGYFMCDKQSRTLDKPFELILQVVIFNEGIYLVGSTFRHESISLKHILGKLIPANWFVILYISLYFISPLLNLTISEMNRARILKKNAIVLVLMFSFYPTLVDILSELTHKEYLGLSSIGMYGSQWGYSIVNFSLMYIIGACLRKKPAAGSVKKHMIMFFTVAVILVCWASVNDRIGFGTERSAWEYCNPFVIFMAVEGFVIFQKIDIGCRKWINHLAGASFTVYLLHARFFKILRIDQFVMTKPWIMALHVIGSAVLIYCVCAIVYELYHRIIGHLLIHLYSQCPIFKRDIYSVEWRE